MRRHLSYAALAMAAGLTFVSLLATPAAAEQQWRDISPPGGEGSVLVDVESAGASTWAVGKRFGSRLEPERPVALRWTGKAWQEPALPEQYGPLLDVSVSGSGQVWAAGTAVDVTADGQSLRAMLLRWKGGVWQKTAPPVPDTATDSWLDAVESTADGRLWAFGGYKDAQGAASVLFHRDTAGAWTTLPANTGLNWVAGLEAAPDGTLTATGDGVSHFDGRTWVKQPLPHSDMILDGLNVRSANDIWAVGFRPDETLWRRPAIVHFDGRSWREIPAPLETGQLYDISFDGSGRPVIVGETQDTAVNEDGNYILTRNQRGAFTRTESPAGAGYLYGAATDQAGNIVTVGGAAGAADSISPGSYAGLRTTRT
ncbi:hypothetical protein [Streptomyces mesophilus]|uniref:hypothetical protein n=1 Tax=Streptomyces mesophilus TaxID=1775132 RepID=UPI00331FB353